MCDTETIDAELRLVADLRCAARKRGGPLPSIDVADALLDERQVLTDWPWRVSSLTNSSHYQRI